MKRIPGVTDTLEDLPALREEFAAVDAEYKAKYGQRMSKRFRMREARLYGRRENLRERIEALEKSAPKF